MPLVAKKPRKPLPVNPTAEELQPKRLKDFVWVGPDDKKLARKVLDICAANTSTALDSEFPPWGDRKDEAIIWSLSGSTAQRFVLDGYWLKDKSSCFPEWIADKRTKLVYFSFGADADVIEKNAKVDCEPSFYSDVKVLGWLRNNVKRRHALKEEGADYLNWWRKDYGKMFGYFPHGKSKWITVPPNVLMEGPLPDEMLAVMSHKKWTELFKHYAADDAEETHTLHRIHKQVLKRWGYWDMYLKLDKPYTITLRHFQKRGIPVDFTELDRLDRNVSIDLLRYKTCLRAIAGKPNMSLDGQSKDLRSLIFKEWGWPTYEDLRTEKGEPQLNKLAWARYAEEEGFLFARHMLPHNKRKTLKNTFINGIRFGVKYGPGAANNTLYSEYNQTGTVSGRMASRKFKVRIPVVRHYKTRPSIIVQKEVKAGMNMLNFPAKHNDVFGIRRVICAPPADDFAPEGYDLICGDYSGFELWMVLYWCEKWGIKSKMLKHMLKDEDVHSMSAIACLGLDCHWSKVKELYKSERDNVGKRANFGLGYGAGVRVFCRILGYDIRDERQIRKAQLIIDRWNERWPEMAQYQKMCTKLGYSQGWVPTIAGRRIWVREGLDSDDDGTVRHFENLCKAGPAQGSAADITKMAQNYIERSKRMKEMGYTQRFNVYDEIIGAIPKRHSEEAVALQTKLMKKSGVFFKMPYELRCEVHAGPTWIDAK